MRDGVLCYVVPASRLEDLIDREDWLSCLEAAGVDNWDGIDYAHEMRQGSEED